MRRLAGTLLSRRRPVPWLRRPVDVVRADARRASQSLVGLAINSATSLVAGSMIGMITHSDTFERYPGLLAMVPAAIGLRGNVFSALGNRVSTSIHAGDYRASLRVGSVMGDNVVASVALTATVSLILALVAAAVAVTFGVAGEISFLALATISVAGGLLASAVVLVITLALVAVAVRAEWDLDNLVAPVVSTFGDVVTVPALWLATFLVGAGAWSAIGGIALVAASAVAGVAVWWSPTERIRRIVRESVPVLIVAVVLSTLAGVVLEKRLDTFEVFPALIVLVPAFVSSAGALGGLLASSLASGLHLGTVDPSARPAAAVWRQARILALAAVPIYALNGAGAHLLSTVGGGASPGAASMVAASLLGAVGAVAFVVVVAYYGSIAAVRFGVDPDTYGIPIVTSSVDFVGAVALILSVSLVGIM